MAKQTEQQKRNSVLAKPRGSIYEFYISGTIHSPENYVEVFDTIRHAGDNDVVKLYINTYGGDMFSAIQFMSVLAETDALVIASVEGACMSAGTLLFLSADRIEVTPHSMFMFHNYSGGAIGKGNEIYSRITHEKKWSERLMHEAYRGFLTFEEVEQLLAGKDIWMDSDEVVSRMENLIKLREAELAEPLVEDSANTEQLAELD